MIKGILIYYARVVDLVYRIALTQAQFIIRFYSSSTFLHFTYIHVFTLNIHTCRHVNINGIQHRCEYYLFAVDHGRVVQHTSIWNESLM